jgi:hypothetical protein
MPKVGHQACTKVAFRPLQEEPVVLQLVEHQTNMMEMFQPRCTENQDVIKEHEDNLAEEGLQYFIHQCLERCRRVCQAEWHHKKFKQTLMCVEGCFLDVVRVHAELMVAGT